MSVLLYKPWRRRIDRKRQQSRLLQGQYEEQYEDEPAAPADSELAQHDGNGNDKKKAVVITTTAEHPHHDNDTNDEVGKKNDVGKKDDDEPDAILPHDPPGQGGKGSRGKNKEVEREEGGRKGGKELS